jgi:hypothetical protein
MLVSLPPCLIMHSVYSFHVGSQIGFGPHCILVDNLVQYCGISKHFINTIKNELPATFVSLQIIVYPTILGVNLLYQFEISGEVHL